jgi:short-subunit dehydrogenase
MPDARTPHVALITGASSGIGEELAKCFAQAGHDLVLVARSADKLKALASDLASAHGVKAWVEPADLSQPAAASVLAARLKRQRRTVDVLVNCAGVLSHGPFATMPAATAQGMIDLNISGLTAMLNAFLPGMVKRGSGRVMNVASIASFQPVPALATYAATKAYVLSLTESLSEELKGSGVTITALCPGVTATHMLTQAMAADASLAKLPRVLVGNAADVARQGFKACMKGQVICVPGVANQATVLASRSTPKWAVRLLGGWLGRRAM